MRRALELATRGWGRVAPNPLVGALVVNGDQIVGEGWHGEYGGPHAEVHALRAAAERAKGATLYVTLEPCAHYGKTPPCTDAILASGIRRVVFAAADPNPRARGGAEVLRAAGLEVHGGVEEQLAREQNAPFFHRFAGTERPWMALKLAVSLDSALADMDGRSQWITGELARQETHRLRAGFDAIAVGSGTALADNPQLTVRGAVHPRSPPTRIVLDRRLRLSPRSALAQSAAIGPVWVIADPAAPTERREPLESMGVRVLPSADLGEALRLLYAEGIRTVLCEGGATLAGALLAQQFVDRFYLFYAPLLLGAGAASAFAGVPGSRLAAAKRWRTLAVEQFGPDTLITLAG